MIIDFQLIWQNLPTLLRGLWLTLQIALISCSIGICLGTLFGLGQVRGPIIVQWLITLYVTIIRGIPMLIQIVFTFYVLPQLGITLPAFWAATCAIGLNSAAYISQIVRSGINSVGNGQLEAARVLGLNGLQAVRFIILPQAFTVVIPALGNEFITLVKDSSLASIVGISELSREGSLIRSRTLDALSVFFAVAALYLSITTLLSILIAHIEKRMNHHVKN